MSYLKFKNVSKTYRKGKRVLSQLNFSVEKGEFIVVVGPSGCGKSTLLRILAGLESATAGEVWIDGQMVNDIDPSERGIAMVFQDYALYPHMTVQENITFGLKMKKLPPHTIEERLKSALTMLQLEALRDRMPAQLSGGQRQRVAIARATVKQPKVFLFDEPLSNLDAQIRTQTRFELNALHQRLGTTSIYVTHDQVEAMTLADRLIVLNHGEIQQIANPREVYEKPANQFVASFIGNPAMNFVQGTRHVGANSQFLFGDDVLVLSEMVLPQIEQGAELFLGIRPEAIEYSPQSADFRMRVTHLERYGHEMNIFGKIGSADLAVRVVDLDQVRALEELRIGAELPVRLRREEVHWFAPSGKRERIAA